MSERKGSGDVSPDSSWIEGGIFEPSTVDPPPASDGPVDNS